MIIRFPFCFKGIANRIFNPTGSGEDDACPNQYAYFKRNKSGQLVESGRIQAANQDE